MSRFEISSTECLGQAAVRLCDPASGSEALIARRGATLLAFRIPGSDGLFDVIDGYPDAAAFAGLKGSRSAIMMPFTNRVADGRYRFDGVSHELPNRRPDGNVMHGLVRDTDWSLVSQDALQGRVVVACDALAQATMPGYPFAVECFAEYCLDGGRLELRLSARNVGERAAPMAMGWHPYFRLPSGDRRVARLAVPADHAVATDERLIPLPGEAAYRSVAAAGCDYREARLLGDAELDTCMTGLRPDRDGLARSRLSDPASGYELVLAQTGGAVHVFTPGFDADGRLDRVAIEPCEHIPDAFNRPACAAGLRLEPGATRALTVSAMAAFGRG